MEVPQAYVSIPLSSAFKGISQGWQVGLDSKRIFFVFDKLPLLAQNLGMAIRFNVRTTDQRSFCVVFFFSALAGVEQKLSPCCCFLCVMKYGKSVGLESLFLCGTAGRSPAARHNPCTGRCARTAAAVCLPPRRSTGSSSSRGCSLASAAPDACALAE